jgi:hypothetical protein
VAVVGGDEHQRVRRADDAQRRLDGVVERVDLVQRPARVAKVVRVIHAPGCMVPQKKKKRDIISSP